MSRFAPTRTALVCLLGLALAGVTPHASGQSCAETWDPVFGAPAPGVVTVVKVLDFTEHLGRLIVAGEFRGVGGAGNPNVESHGVASWTPSGGWQTMSFSNPSGQPQPVESVAVFQGTLYAGGVLDWTEPDACGPNPCPDELRDVGALAYWDGIDWNRVPGGPGGVAAVRALEVHEGVLFVGGHLGPLPQTQTDTVHLFTWDGTGWGVVAGGVTGESGGPADAPGVWDLLSVDDPLLAGLYVAGQFEAADALSGPATDAPVPGTRGIARWDGAQWHAVGGGLDPLSQQCGLCDVPGGGLPATFGAGADGRAVDPMPLPCTPHVGALELFDDGAGPRLFAGGAFHEIGRDGGGLPTKDLGGSVEAHNLAAWDGAAWSPLGMHPDDGVNGVVAALEVMAGGSALAVGGRFATAACAAVGARNVARWDGFQWAALNGGLDGIPTAPDNGNFAHALHLYGPAGGEFLFAGGSFDCASNGDAAGGAPSFQAVSVARWGCLAAGCQGDLDFDGSVDVEDFLQLLAEWGPCAGCPEPCASDLDGNGAVDVTDQLTVLANWGPCP